MGRRIQCLKYLILSNMLMNSDISPFDSQEAKPYKNDPEILAMTNLLSAYMNNEIRAPAAPNTTAPPLPRLKPKQPAGCPPPSPRPPPSAPHP